MTGSAQVIIDKAARLDPANADYIHNRGHCSYFLGDTETALEDFGAAIAMDGGALHPEWRAEKAEMEKTPNSAQPLALPREMCYDGDNAAV